MFCEFLTLKWLQQDAFSYTTESAILQLVPISFSFLFYFRSDASEIRWRKAGYVLDWLRRSSCCCRSLCITLNWHMRGKSSTHTSGTPNWATYTELAEFYLQVKSMYDLHDIWSAASPCSHEISTTIAKKWSLYWMSVTELNIDIQSYAHETENRSSKGTLVRLFIRLFGRFFCECKSWICF